MNYDVYMKLWDEVSPLMLDRMKQLHAELKGFLGTNFTVSEPVMDTKVDSFKISLSVSNDTMVYLGVDFVMDDSDYVECDDDGSGAAVKMEIIGHSGLALGGYFPAYFTSEAWTTDVQQLRLRIDAAPVTKLARYIVDKALKNPVLLSSIAESKNQPNA